MNGLLLRFRSQLLNLTGFSGFWQTLELNVIYTWTKVHDSLCHPNATVESLPGMVWHCIKNRSVEVFLLGGIRLSEDAKRKIVVRLRDFWSYRKSVLSCVVILGFCYCLKRQYHLESEKKRRKIALLCKGSEQSLVNYNLKDIEKNILSRLQQELRNESIQLVEEPWNQVLDDGKQPVIVFCVISSRIGTDIENAMRGVHGNSRVVLVLLHSVLRELLRGELSDDEELLDTTMKNRMTSIAHFAFSDREGLYACHQNTVGFKKLRYTIRFLPS